MSLNTKFGAGNAAELTAPTKNDFSRTGETSAASSNDFSRAGEGTLAARPLSHHFDTPVDTTAPTITSSNALSVAENSAFSHTLTANESVTWTKTGGTDAALFTLTGNSLTMTAKNFESPVDSNANNTYVVQVTATDAAGNATSQTITVTVTNVNESTDPNWDNVIFLAGFDGANNATSYTEESQYARVATFNGNAALSTSTPALGTAALTLDGAGDYLTFPDDDLFRLISTAGEAFTIEGRIRFASIAAPAGSQYMLAQWDTSTNNRGWHIGRTTGNAFYFQYSTDGVNSAAAINILANVGTLTANTWYAFAVESNGTNIRTYWQGSMVTKTSSIPTVTIFNAAVPLGVGGRQNGAFYHNGGLDEIRITKGVARYNSDAGYTPASGLFPRANT